MRKSGYILVVILISVVFVYLYSKPLFEGFQENYENCSDIKNCGTCSTTLTATDGKCAWCKKKNSCVTTSLPLKSDLNYVQKMIDYRYFINPNNQNVCDCGYNRGTCGTICDNPDTPDTPDTPDDPEDPDTPDTPDDPEDPDTPDTPDDPPAAACSKYTLIQSPIYVKTNPE